MHYSVLVIAPPKTVDIEGYVQTALAPFDENDEKPHDCGWEKENHDKGCDFRANRVGPRGLRRWLVNPWDYIWPCRGGVPMSELLAALVNSENRTSAKQEER